MYIAETVEVKQVDLVLARFFFLRVRSLRSSKSCFKFIQLKDFRGASVRIFYCSQNVLELPLELTLALKFSGVIFYSVLDRMLPWLNFFL